MGIDELEERFQTALRKRFPGVIVREATWVPEEDIFPFLDVFMIDDDQGRDFWKFQLNDWGDFIKAEGLPDCDVFPRSVSQTRESRPRIWAEAQRELKAATRVATSRVKRAPKSKPRSTEKSPARVKSSNAK